MQLYDSTATSSTDDPQLAPNVPFNIEVEQGVLGALFCWNAAIDDIPFLEWHHFYDPLHQAIFSAASEAIKAGKPANPVTLAKKDELAKAHPVDGLTTVPQYLGKLGGALAASRHQIEGYARILVDLALRRSIILVTEEIAEDAREAALDVIPASIIEDAGQRLLSLSELGEAETATLLTFRDAMTIAVERAGSAYTNKFSGLKTHISSLDLKLGGLQPTDLIVLAGRPGMGKTALATNIAFNVAHYGKTPVAFFSL
jgi:replicative DNA helicase